MSTFDTLIRRPINRVAKWVTGKGEQFQPNKMIQTNDSQDVISTRPFNKTELGTSTFIDLTGRTVGRFTVLGIARDFPGQWVVRCICGVYSTRRAKSIKNPENTQDRCEHCRHLAYLKRNEVWRRTGSHPDIRTF